MNKRGYNKFLDISKDIEVSINENKILEDAACEGIQQWIIRSMTTQFHGRKASSFSEHDHPKTVLKP